MNSWMNLEIYEEEYAEGGTGSLYSTSNGIVFRIEAKNKNPKFKEVGKPTLEYGLYLLLYLIACSFVGPCHVL